MMLKNKQFTADMMLVVVTLCWGVSYYLMDIALTDMDAFTLNAHRFLGAFFIAGALSWKKLRNVSRTTLKYSVLVGLALVVVYTSVTFGVQYTTLSNSGFLCALTVVFTPIIGFIFLKQRLSRKMILSVSVCLVGIALLTLKDDFSINMANLKGDVLCAMCAVAYAVHLLLTERAVAHEDVDAYQLGVFQLGVTGVCNLILAFFFETPHFPTEPGTWSAVVFLTVFCTGVAFVVQPMAQQYTTAAHVGVIYALEPVFAGIVAFLLAGEVLSGKAYFGAFLMLASIFIMEIDFDIKEERREQTIHQITGCDSEDGGRSE